MRVVLLVATLLALSLSASAILTIRRFNETYATAMGARCLDGSVGAYWFEAGAAANQTKWVFFLAGGGFCGDEIECKDRSRTDLGSSLAYADTRTGSNILSSSATSNPDFATWNHISVPYCSGDLYSGTRMTNTSATWGLYFGGHNIIKAIIQDLEGIGRFSAATDVVFGGGSAGGVGSWVNVDYVKSRVPSARVVAMPNAGYFSAEQTYPGVIIANPGQFQSIAVNVWQSRVPPSCASRIPASNISLCLLGDYGPTSIPTEVFWIQAIPDTNLMSAQLGFPGFGSANMSVATPWILSLYNSRVTKMQQNIFSRSDWGWWITSSFTHGVAVTSTCITGGGTWLETIGNWYFNRAGPKRLFDECGSSQVATIIQQGATTEANSCTATRQCVPQGLLYAPTSPPFSQVSPAPKASTSTSPGTQPTVNGDASASNPTLSVILLVLSVVLFCLH